MRVKEALKQNRFMYYFIKKGRNAQIFMERYITLFFIPNIHFNLKWLLRVFRIDKNTPYEKLKTIENKYFGKRCFIVATGPSLTVEDLEKLENEITFSMNSICLAFNDTNWRPTYYGVQDSTVFMKMQKYIDHLKAENIFVSDVISKQINQKLSTDYYYLPVKLLYHNEETRKYNIKFSDNPFSVVYNGYTITYSLIQLAVYMGFKEIYLLGADCHYGNDMNHHFINYDHVDSAYASAGEMMTVGYKEAKKYADKHGISIYNATRGGRLEVFERVTLEEALSKK